MSKHDRQKRIKMFVTIFTFVALLVITFAIRGQIADTINNLQRANPWPVLLIIPLALFNHFSQGKLYQGVFRILGDRFRTRSMMRLSLELGFVNNVFPSAGVSGFSYLSIRMKDEEVAAGKATLVQAMRFALMFVSFQILLGIGLLLLAAVGNANNFVVMVAASLATFLSIGTALAVFVISSNHRINSFFTGLTRVLNRVIQVVRPKNPETINISSVEEIFTELHENYMLVRQNLSELKGPILYAFASNVAEVAAIYAVFLAFGHVVNPGAVILAYSVANFAGLMSVLPGGVGVYEGLMTGVLVAAGVPVAVSLPVIVTFRVVSMAFQIPMGYYFYQKNLRTPSHL